MRTAVSAAFLLLTCLLVLAAQAMGRSGAERTQFSAEGDTVKRPIVLPDEALRAIKEDPYVAEMLRNEVPPAKQIPIGWLEVHLAGPDENDIIVIATGSLRGTNMTRFLDSSTE